MASVETRALTKQFGENQPAVDRIDLLASDKFLEQSYVPIEVSVEALDNDPVSGPKWGKSAAMVRMCW